MFMVTLRFSSNKRDAGKHMDGHNAWLKQGFDDGVFVLAGSLQPGLGGAILAHNTTAEALGARVGADPFVAGDVVTAEIAEITPNRTDDRLAFLAA